MFTAESRGERQQGEMATMRVGLLWLLLHGIPVNLAWKNASLVGEARSGNRRAASTGIRAPLVSQFAHLRRQAVLRAAEVYERPALVNLSSGVETNIAAVVEALRDITAYPGTVVWDDSRPDGQLRRVFDVSLAAQELGFSAATPLREGLAATVRWYRKNHVKRA